MPPARLDGADHNSWQHAFRGVGWWVHDADVEKFEGKLRLMQFVFIQPISVGNVTEKICPSLPGDHLTDIFQRKGAISFDGLMGCHNLGNPFLFGRIRQKHPWLWNVFARWRTLNMELQPFGCRIAAVVQRYSDDELCRPATVLPNLQFVITEMY